MSLKWPGLKGLDLAKEVSTKNLQMEGSKNLGER